MKNIFKSATLVLIASLAITSCTKDFAEINKNPYQPDETQIPNRAGTFMLQMQQYVIPVQENSFQMSESLVGDNFSGYMTSPGDFGGLNSNTYFWRDNWVESPYNDAFKNIFGGYIMVKKYTDDASLENIAMADIVKVAAIHRMTDIYGPTPYSQAGSGSNKVAYDSQQDVYTGMIKDLDAAIKFLEDFAIANPGATPLKNYDLIYKGDLAKWAKLGNSLKLRLAVRMAYADPALAQKCAEEAVNHSIGLLETADDIAKIECTKNPLNVMWDTYADTRMGASMQSIMVGYNDPRLPKYFQKTTHPNSLVAYQGARNGMNKPTKANFLTYSSPAATPTDPIIWMAPSEIAFLRAEGALRGWSMGGTAKDFYEKGVELSFSQYGLGGAPAYLADNTAIPADYTSPVTQSPSTPALSKITIMWDDAASMELNLERIITQKWIALYPNGQEAWTEFRRTGYPKIFPVVKNDSPAGSVDTNKQLRRMPFPPKEYTDNAEAMQKALGLLGGPDTGGTKLWWDKK